MVGKFAVVRADVVANLFIWIASCEACERFAGIVFIPIISSEKIGDAFVLPCVVILVVGTCAE